MPDALDEGGLIYKLTPCLLCKHFDRRTIAKKVKSCTAFKRIPEIIWSARNPHTQRLGNEPVIFEMKETIARSVINQ
jgi:hypothetical protein